MRRRTILPSILDRTLTGLFRGEVDELIDGRWKRIALVYGTTLDEMRARKMEVMDAMRTLHNAHCCWCGRKLDRNIATITVQNTDGDGTTHRLAWCAGTGCTENPVYRAVCQSRRIPSNALMVLAERRRAALRDEMAANTDISRSTGGGNGK
ncbi:MAG: hypothetical protein WC992_05140 [Acholeplasmataceae bacterium]